jgi:general secretion pathway protein G
MSKAQRAFTLIELLVVMSIVALLLTLALPRYFGSLDKAKDVALQENLKVVRATLDKFQADKGRYPKDLQELVDQRYLRSLPVDPVTEQTNTWVLVPAEDVVSGGVSDVRSGAPGASREGKPYASY